LSTVRASDTTSRAAGCRALFIPRGARRSNRVGRRAPRRFERSSPCGDAETIAEFLAPYVDAGCRTFNLLACAAHPEEAVAGVTEVRRLLSKLVPVH
jgi:alkanesulfonate monooxygenase SsuD/methylene tetrahydromethanopterin reductase-like flavin-dependent oxidoreductase (luciferase family)